MLRALVFLLLLTAVAAADETICDANSDGTCQGADQTALLQGRIEISAAQKAEQEPEEELKSAEIEMRSAQEQAQEVEAQAEAPTYHNLGTGYCSTSDRKTFPSAYARTSEHVCKTKCNGQLNCIGFSYARSKGVCNLHAKSAAILEKLKSAVGYASFNAANKCQNNCHIDRADASEEPSWGWQCYRKEVVALAPTPAPAPAPTPAPMPSGSIPRPYHNLGTGYCSTSDRKTFPSAYARTSEHVCKTKCNGQLNCIGFSYARSKGVCNLHAKSAAILEVLKSAVGYASFNAANKCQNNCHIDRADASEEPSWGWQCYRKEVVAPAPTPAPKACPLSYELIGTTCFSPSRTTASLANGQSSCAPILNKCTSEGARLASKQQTEAWVANGGNKLGKTYGLTSTMKGSTYWFNGYGPGWYAGYCDRTSRYFVCAVEIQAEAPTYHNLGTGYCSTSDRKTFPSAYAGTSQHVCNTKCNGQLNCIGFSYAHSKGVCNLHAKSAAILKVLKSAVGYPSFNAANKCQNNCHIDRADASEEPSWGWQCYRKEVVAPAPKA